MSSPLRFVCTWTVTTEVRYPDLAPFDALIWPHLTPQTPYLLSCPGPEGGRRDAQGGAVRAYAEGLRERGLECARHRRQVRRAPSQGQGSNRVVGTPGAQGPLARLPGADRGGQGLRGG